MTDYIDQFCKSKFFRKYSFPCYFVFCLCLYVFIVALLMSFDTNFRGRKIIFPQYREIQNNSIGNLPESNSNKEFI